MYEDTVTRPDKHGFVAHTPDPSAYHPAPGGGTMIPHYEGGNVKTGGRKAPITVYIDPTDPLTGAGGTRVDFDPHGTAKTAVNPAPAPAAVPEPAPAPEPVPMPPPEPQRIQQYVPPAPAQPDSSQALLAAISSLQQTVGSLAQSMQPPAQVVPEPPTACAPPPEDAVKKVAYRAEEVESYNPFEELKIPGLAEKPTKPRFRVEFNLGEGGRQEAWYHWIGHHNGCLFLIYDTRFEFGMRYSPPNTGDSRTISVSLPDAGRSFEVFSTDMIHPFGVFYITTLVIAANNAQQPTEYDSGGFNEAIMPQIDKVTADVGHGAGSLGAGFIDGPRNTFDEPVPDDWPL